tara:strand:- start:128 stop:1084 length:957 start_codon:yes stop_codon:yes gene_type:complete
MVEIDKKFFEINNPLTLDEEIDSGSYKKLILDKEINSNQNIKNEIFKIKNLIDTKYLSLRKSTLSNIKSSKDTNFNFIKNSTSEINKDIKENKNFINNTIKDQENELELLYREKELLNQNKIQSNIIIEQKKLIDNYKKDINELKFNLKKIEEKLDENIYSNERLTLKNNESKKIINDFIEKNDQLNKIIKKLEKTISDNPLTPEQINELNNKIKFYQEENIRLSSELNLIQNNYSTIKSNFAKLELEKNNIYRQIQELNNSLIKTNIVGTPFVKETIEEDSINSKILNDITNNNLEDEKKASKPKIDLDDEINDIFS